MAKESFIVKLLGVLDVYQHGLLDLHRGIHGFIHRLQNQLSDTSSCTHSTVTDSTIQLLFSKHGNVSLFWLFV